MHANFEDSQKRIAEYNESLIKDENLGDLIDQADDIFSQWVRLSAADRDGFILCFICGKRVHWKEAENMHYIKRGASLYLRFDPRNNKAGCHECNSVKGGNYFEYAKKLDAATPGITDILYEEGNLVIKPSREEIRQIISQYTPLVKQMKLKLKS